MTPTPSLLTSGIVTVTVTPDPHWRFARLMLGNEYHETYTYRIERAEDGTLFLSTLTARPSKLARFVYTGILHPRKGTLRLTRNSAFPDHATRVRVARHVFEALFAGRGDAIERANWTVEAEVERELARF